MSLDPIEEKRIFRQLQQHLDRQPVGFPATSSGIELKVLQHIFTARQARIALCLSHKARNVDDIFAYAGRLVDSKEQLVRILEEMVAKGAIETGNKNGQTWFRNAPLVVGMYEYQLDRLTPRFIEDFGEYTSSREFGISFLSVKLPQMRTIPVHKSIRIESRVANFDDTIALLEQSDGPFAICECICRKKQGLLGNTCKVTDRLETCLALGDLAETAVKNGMGKPIEPEQAVKILELNQKEGLVIQPSNTQEAGFICSCCGCCCGMLRMHKKLPRPLDFWATNHVAGIDFKACSACGLCFKKCQVDAVLFDKSKNSYRIDDRRCIGCGLCVAACPCNAVELKERPDAKAPPRTREDLFDLIGASKKGRLGKALLTGKLVKDAIVTGRLEILKSR